MKEHRPSALWADRVGFRAKGKGAKAFLSRAARDGVRVFGITCAEDGYTGYVSGADFPRLRQAAEASGAELSVRERRGPGRLLERCAARPGLLAGALVFFFLQWYLGGFLWNIGFGTLDREEQDRFRAALAQEGIWEGCRMEEETLRLARQALETEMQETGWFSLNFVSGCLFIEETNRLTQTVREEPAAQALYAKAAGQVLTVELESGFAQVAVGQYVAEGQLLANGQKADRDGNAVVQGASGSIRGRIRKIYTAVQPMYTEAEILTGRSSVEETWQLLGYTWYPEQEQAELPAGWQSSMEWIPFGLGRAALPGAVCRTTYWEKAVQTLVYTETTAQAMAARACRMQLLQQFPDAELENQTLDFHRQGEEVSCTAEYVFCADMAQPGELFPLEPVENTG